MALKIAKAFDALVGGLMIGLMFVTFGAYSNFTLPTLLAGIVYLAVQKPLYRKADIRAVKRVLRVLRVIAVLWFAAVFAAIFCVTGSDPKLYTLKKTLYSAGNYSDNRVLDVLPDDIPECTGYKARFGAPMAGQDAHGYVTIEFTTDGAGLDYLRSQAESRGGDHHFYAPEDAETRAFGDGLRLGSYVKYAEGFDVTELYAFSGTRSRNNSCYLMNAETGQVVINW